MSRILEKQQLAEKIFLIRIHAPEIAKKAEPGQFVILRIDEKGERIPLSIADMDDNSITLVYLVCGATTHQLSELKKGGQILDFVGPLGNASEIRHYGTVVLVGGGLGAAPLYPLAKSLKKERNKVIVIVGARTKALHFWLDRLKEVSDELVVATDDGSFGVNGVVTVPLKEVIEKEHIDVVFTIGPPIMMKFVAEATRDRTKTIASINTIMVDGMGMCGGCRIKIGDEVKFACVDGPDFDAHKVDWDEFLNRNKRYLKEEEHVCKLSEKA